MNTPIQASEFITHYNAQMDEIIYNINIKIGELMGKTNRIQYVPKPLEYQWFKGVKEVYENAGWIVSEEDDHQMYFWLFEPKNI